MKLNIYDLEDYEDLPTTQKIKRKKPTKQKDIYTNNKNKDEE